MEEEPKKFTEKELKFARDRNNAKRNLIERLKRNPTAAEIMGLIAVRRQARNENQYMAEIIGKAEVRAAIAVEAKAAAKAAADGVRMKQKAAADGVRMKQKAAADEAKGLKIVDKEEAKLLKKEERAAMAITKKVAKGEAKALEAKAKGEAKKTYINIETTARNNLTRALGKAPRAANVRKLASMRQAGTKLPINNFLKTTRKMKAKNSLERFFSSDNSKPEIDVCAACELKKFLEKQ